MTNQQGAPEALRLAEELEIPIAEFPTPTRLEQQAAAELRRLHAENERLAALVEAQQPAPSAAADPMDWPLPCDVTVGHGTMCKGVSLRTLVMRMKVLYEMATGNNADEVANRTPEENTALADAFRARIAAAPQPTPTPQADSQPAADEDIAMSRTQDLAESGRWPSDWVEAYRRGYSDRAARAPADSVTAPATDSYVQPVPDKCDRIVWRGHYYHMPPTPPAQAADSVLEDAALSSEQQRAIFEAYENAASESYFEVRPQIDCSDRRRVFKAGYERGWDAARKQGGA